MKKSSPHLLSFYNYLKSASIPLLILLLLNSTLTEAQTSNQFLKQEQFDPGINYPLVFLDGQSGFRQQTAGAKWETIQTIVINQPAGQNIFAKPVGLDLDQVRNGSGDNPVNPPSWVNGNAGASNAHYVEGYSIPYRVVIDNLPGLGARSVDIEWDIRHSGANAIDFITHFDMIDYPAGSHVTNFGHVKETLNPLTEAGDWDEGDPNGNIPIPNLAGAPASVTTLFNAIQGAGLGKFSIWNGNITGLTYISQGSLAAASSSTRIRIFFENTNPDNSTVIIAWGGHIAKGEGYWGAGNSASAVSGSPYHTRLIEWDADGAGPQGPTSIGNQDRSLSAEAVLDPPICDLDGDEEVECNTQHTYTSGVTAADLPAGVSFEWTLINNTSGATFNGATTNVESVSVNAGTGCNTGYTVKFKLIKNNLEISNCILAVTVDDNTAPVLGTCPAGSDLGCNPAGLPAPVNPSATDNCGTPTVTSSEGAISSNGCTRSQTRTYTAADACGNTATCSQTFTWTADLTGPGFTSCPAGSDLGCNPTSIPEPGVATATDACGTPTITSSLGAEAGTSCSRSRTRTYTATDACGNTSTCQQVFTYTVDVTAPAFTFCPPGSDLGCNPTSIPDPGAATATDACGTPTITSVLGNEVGTGCSRSKTRTYTARDACGNSSTCQQVFTYTVDVTAPAFTFCPPGSNVGCNPTSFPEPGAATATDACATPTITSVLGNEVGTGCSRSRTRTYTARDACGNTSTCQQVFTYTVDVTPPDFTACQSDVTVECGDPTSTAALGSATASDACGSTTVTANDATPTQVGCQTVIVRTWTARDACGNTATCVQRILIIDRIAPTITCNADGSATASDACGSYYLYQNGTTWTAMDASGNIRTASCIPQAGRIASPQVIEEQKEQQQITANEEQTKAAVPPKPIVQDITVQAIPNPFTDKVKFVITTPEAGYASLDVMNMLGQKLKTVFQGQLNAGEQFFDMSLPASRYSTLFYILRLNGKQVTGKLVQRN